MHILFKEGYITAKNYGNNLSVSVSFSIRVDWYVNGSFYLGLRKMSRLNHNAFHVMIRTIHVSMYFNLPFITLYSYECIN